jgi:hypothetical protein
LAETSLIKGSKNDLRTLVWLVNKLELDKEKKQYLPSVPAGITASDMSV